MNLGIGTYVPLRNGPFPLLSAEFASMPGASFWNIRGRFIAYVSHVLFPHRLMYALSAYYFLFFGISFQFRRPVCLNNLGNILSYLSCSSTVHRLFTRFRGASEGTASTSPRSLATARWLACPPAGRGVPPPWPLSSSATLTASRR